MTDVPLRVGDLVTVDPALFATRFHGIVFEIVKAPRTSRETNYTARPRDDHNGRGVKAPAYGFRRYDPDAPAETVPYVAPPELGALVRVNGIPKIDPTDLFVVLGDSRKPNAVKLVRLGGAEGRYWPSIPVDRLTIVDPRVLRDLFRSA